MRRILIAAFALFLMGSFAGIEALAQRAPLGVIVVPPGEFQIRVRTDKPAYQVGFSTSIKRRMFIFWTSTRLGRSARSSPTPSHRVTS